MAIKKDSWEEYQSKRYLNGSTLVHGLKSMRALKRALERRDFEQTDAMRLGSGIHCLLLEPDKFAERYCVVPEFHLDSANVTANGKPTDSKSTNYYKSAVSAFELANRDKDVLSRSQYDTILTCIQAVRSKPEAVRLLDAAGSNVELTVEGEIVGVQFKGRVDALAPAAIIDLKSTQSADPVAFSRSFVNLHYGMKLAIYWELIRQSIAARPVVVIAQETSGDFDTVVFDVPEVVLRHGLQQAKRIVEQYRRCIETGEWPGVDCGSDRVPLLVPDWALRDMDDNELVVMPDVDASVDVAF